MKKLLLLFCMLMPCAVIQAQVSVQRQISFICQGIHHGSIGHNQPRSPINPPTVYLEDQALTFVADHPEYVLYIKDEDEEVVYSAVVTSAETEVTLPTYLSGTYEIELVMGNWLFTGWIDL